MTGKRRKSEKICVNPHEKNNLWKKSVGIHEICGTKIINKKNLCKSVKSVGLKQSMRKNLRHLRNLRDKLIFSGEEKDPREEKQKNLRNLSKSEALHWKEAATYSPALHCSTIGASGLNFSVRNGKRWNPTAITTW